MDAMIHVGASKEAVATAKVGILDILNSGQDQTTIQVALEVFGAICAVHNVSISDCTLYGKPPRKGKKK